MKNIINKFTAAIVASLLLVSCTDDTTDVLDESTYPQTISELYAGLWGCASTVADVADQALIIEALRGNLAQPTSNAGTELWDIYEYRDLNGNSLVDPAGYYRIIMNVNDYVAHVNAFRQENPTALNFEEMYGVSFDMYISTAIRYKVWAYLMLGKIYGEAVYFDDPLKEYQDIKNYPTLNFEQIIEKCMQLMTTGMYGVDGMQMTRWRTFLFPSTTGEEEGLMRYDRYQFTPYTLLAELYLWKAALSPNPNDYKQAAINAMTEITNGGYTSGAENYLLSLRGAYGSNFKNAIHTYYRWEDVTMASYNPRVGESNRLEDYASNVAPYSYYVMPTDDARARFDTTYIANSDQQYRDNRGSGRTFSEATPGQYVLTKWINGSSQTSETIIAIYRASNLHLMLCEALSGVARFTTDETQRHALIEAALALINGGIGSYWNASTGAYAEDSCFDILYDIFGKGSTASPYLANLYRGGTHENSASQYINRGVRGRVDMLYVGDSILVKDELTNDYLYTPEQQCWKLDSLIAEENFFELSGEGHVMFTMHRIKRSYAGAHDDFFIDWMAGGRAAAAGALASEDGWFVGYDLKGN
ncbi:MAG TPA: hypothetical protein IAD09_05130 [Candidatus Caccoplasma merdavium]|nr:hypothetical protein [Candidatus Caccoplasma merdavium]